MKKQTFQDIRNEVIEELKKVPDSVDDLHVYFYELKKQFPKRFERLLFDTNGHLPYSKDLSEIIFTAKLAGKWPLYREWRNIKK